MTMQIYPASSASSAIRGLTFTVIKRPLFNTIVQDAPNFYCTRIGQTRNPSWRWTLLYEVLFNDPANIVNGNAPWTDLQALMGFFMDKFGQQTPFLFDDPDDDSVGPGVTTAGWKASTYYPVSAGLLVAGHWQKATVAGISGSSAPAFSTAGSHVSEGPSSPQLRWDDQGSGYTAVPNLFAQLPLVQDTSTGLWYSPLQRNLGGFAEDVTDLNGSLTLYGNGAVLTGTDAGALSSTPGLAIPGASYMGLYIAWTTGYVPTAPVTASFKFYFRVRFETDAIDFEKFVSDLWTIGGSEGTGGAGSITLVSDRPASV
jgi:hypothetical protein